MKPRVDFHLRVTSRVYYFDGHWESGPSTSMDTTMTSYDAYRQIEKIATEIASKVHYEHFGHRVLKFLDGVFVPSTKEAKANTKKEVVYYLKAWYEGYDENGRLIKEDSYNSTTTKPIWGL